MAKSSWKFPYTIHFPEFWEDRKRKIQITDRSSTITPGFAGKTVFIYNGRSFVERELTLPIVGEKFGSYTVNRSRHIFKGKTAKDKK